MSTRDKMEATKEVRAHKKEKRSRGKEKEKRKHKRQDNEPITDVCGICGTSCKGSCEKDKHDRCKTCNESPCKDTCEKRKKCCFNPCHPGDDERSSSEECQNPVISIIGAGCAGAYLINKLSKKYHVEAYEAGINRLNDGFTFNLAIGAPASASQYNNVAPNNPAIVPGLTQWAGLTFQLPWTVVTPSAPSPLIPGANWSQGVMIGGSNEHIQGVYVNPSHDRCNWWAEILKDKRYKFRNLFPLLTEMEHFRYHTDLTTQTPDVAPPTYLPGSGTPYGPLDGPSLEGSKPINRGYNGLIQVVQSFPSTFSKALGKAIYDQFNGVLDIEQFTLQPIIDDVKSTTFNSGINGCVTLATETWLDKHRVRSTVARNYLNSSVMTNDPANDKRSPAYSGVNPIPFTVNNGIQRGLNCHDFNLTTNALVQRIVFETKPGYPCGEQYWIPNYPVDQIDICAFKRPLKAIGIVYTINNDDTNTNTGQSVFVPSEKIICSAGVLATPIVLMQSGIGPRNVLEPLGIPVLFDQPNMGEHVSNHVGATLRWTGNAAVWGAQERGTANSNGYLPTIKNVCRRKYQYFSTATTTASPPNWSMNFYDLQPKSTGFVRPVANGAVNNTLLALQIFPEYFTNQEDRDDLCWVFRQAAAAVIAADPTAVFTNPNLPYPFPIDNDVLFPAIIQFFVQQAHYVGSCGMGPDPRYHCVDTNFLLRGTRNVYVCDASSTPLEIDCDCNAYPVQNDGNTSRGINVLSVVLADQLLCDKK